MKRFALSITINTNISNTDLVAEVLEESRRVYKELCIRDEKGMSFRHMLQNKLTHWNKKKTYINVLLGVSGNVDTKETVGGI